METNILSGKKIAKEIQSWVKQELQHISKMPKLASVVVTQDKSTQYYVKNQKKIFEKYGIGVTILNFPENISEKELLEEIEKLNNDNEITGILLCMPLPEHINTYNIKASLAPEKDVEGITPTNMGKLFYGDLKIMPCTVEAIWLMLKATEINLSGKEIVVISHSGIVGKPLLAVLLSSERNSPTPTCCHIATKDLLIHTKKADIIIVAVGKAGFITRDMVKPGVIIIDVGINVLIENGKKKFVGDVNFESLQGVAHILTPVPGGVGTVTSSVLLRNCIKLAKDS